MNESELERSTENSATTMRRRFFFVVFAVVALLTFLLIYPFFHVIAVVLVLVVVSKPLYTSILSRKRMRNHKRFSASLTLAIIVLVLIIPILIISYAGITQAVEMLEDFAGIDLASITTDIFETVSELPLLPELESETVEITEVVQSWALKAATWLKSILLNFISSLPRLFIQALIFIILYIALLPEFDKLVSRGQEISLLGVEISGLYYRKATAMTSSMFKGIFIIALLEGVLMGFFFWLAGVEATLLITLISIIFALLPVVGISYLTIFSAIIFIINGNYTSALIVLFGFYGVVNWIDIFLRPRLVSKEAYMHFALVLLGIFGGLYWAGLLGLIYGPVLMILFVTTIEIYIKNYAGVVGDSLTSYAGAATGEE